MSGCRGGTAGGRGMLDRSTGGGTLGGQGGRIVGRSSGTRGAGGTGRCDHTGTITFDGAFAADAAFATTLLELEGTSTVTGTAGIIDLLVGIVYLQPLCATGDGRAPEAVCAAKYVSSGSKKKLLLVAPLQGAFPIVYILASCLSVTDQPVLLATGAKNCCSRRRHKATHRPKQTLQPIEPTSKRFPHNGHCFSSPSSHLWRENKTKLKHLVESLVAYSFLLCEQTRHQPFHVAATFAPSPLRTRNRRHARLA